MRSVARLFTGAAAGLIALLPAITPAKAERAHSYMSSAGTTFAGCGTPDSPCFNLNAALASTASGGVISCLDGGDGLVGFGSTTITKSMTIDCAGTTAMFLGIVVDAPGHVVTIRNITIVGTFTHDEGNSLPIGIEFKNARTLFVEHCTITNEINAPAVGIKFRPSAAGSKLVVTDTSFINNGIDAIGGGIVVSPQPGGTAQAIISRVTVSDGRFGIVADGSGSTGGINMTISDSVTSNNSQDGIVATTPPGGAPIGVLVTNTKSVNNNIGIRSIGAGVTVRVESSKITGNGTGLSFSGGGALLSAGNNMTHANGANGAFSGSAGLQ